MSGVGVWRRRGCAGTRRALVPSPPLESLDSSPCRSDAPRAPPPGQSAGAGPGRLQRVAFRACAESSEGEGSNASRRVGRGQNAPPRPPGWQCRGRGPNPADPPRRGLGGAVA